MTNDTQTIDADALRARLAETPTAAEVGYLDALLARQHAILTGVADALRGDPGPLASHSHHDLAERAASVVALLAVTQASLEAASSGRRVTVVDDIERLQRERDALRDAARECLDALEAPAPVWDADESEHDEHAARLTDAVEALRPLVGDAVSALVTAAEAQALLGAPESADELQCAPGRPCRACDARIAAAEALTDAAPALVATIATQAAEIERLRRALLPDVVDSLCVDSLRARAEAAERERDALRDAVQEYLDARHRALVATLAYLDADPADAAARDAASASEARVTAARTRLTTLADDTTMRAR